MWRAKFGVRGSVLTIALVPSLALLSAGVGVSGYLVREGVHVQNWSKEVDHSTNVGVVFTDALQQERRLTLLVIAGDWQASGDLAAARKQVDQVIAAQTAAPDSLQHLDPGQMQDIASAYAPLIERMPTLRQQVDNGTASAAEAYDLYSRMIGLAVDGMDLISRTAPDAGTSVDETKARNAFLAAEAMSSAAALSAPAMIRTWLTAAEFPQFSTRVGSYRSDIEDLTTQLSGDPLARLQALIMSPAWQRVNAVEDIILRRGVMPTDEDSTADVLEWAPDIAQWQDDAVEVNRELLQIFSSQQDHALAHARANGDRISRDSVLGGVAVLMISIAAFGVALWLSSTLIRRLRRLRAETLTLADVQLPDIMDRLRRGETVDLDTDVTRLEYGADEIGQVGDAFNRAQLAAVSAAVTEARTREGVRAVFLNIAHRSQVVVHKQLEILDKAEYETADNEQLEMLFRLDHLATRERRNAENLIILGGEQPGRRWRTPVPLVGVVRSAIAETEEYRRVHAEGVPQFQVVGTVVADLVHLLAELVDNATLFSPPESNVDVTGNEVGRGVVIEIADRGLGIGAEELARINSRLADPPDFSVESLSSDSRLGLFVVARLAMRNAISVRLVESDYGGIRAIVLIPTALIAPEPAPDEPDLDIAPQDWAAARHRITLVEEAASWMVATGSRRSNAAAAMPEHVFDPGSHE